MSIATKTGDRGQTALLFGRRVPKSHLKVEAYGAVDELSAVLGLARPLAAQELPPAADLVRSIQQEMVTLMGELAVQADDRGRFDEKGFGRVGAAMVDRLTSEVDKLEAEGLKFDGWATPGATPLAAAFDFARVVCRRAERRVVALDAADPVNPEILRYLNRLSDLCWLLARKAESLPAAR